MKISNDRIADQLNRKLAPAYLLCSDEPLLLGEAADAVRHAAREQGYETRELMFAERGFDWQQLHACSANLSLFSQRRILEIRMPGGKPGKPGAAALSAYVADPPEDSLLIVVSGKLDKSNRSAAWVKAFEKNAVVFELAPVGPGQLSRWIGARMQKAGLKCSPEAAALLAERAEGNLLAAAQEIEKLRLLNGPGKVDADMVLRSVADSARFDVFALGDAAMAGDAARVIRIIDGVRREGVAVQLVLWALNRTVHELERCAWGMQGGGLSVDAVMAQARVWSSRKPLVKAALTRHRLPEFYRMIERVGEIDRASKGQGPGDAWLMINQLGCDLAGTSVFREPGLLRRAG